MIFVICAAKAFGVTDFINPNDIDETVQQVHQYYVYVNKYSNNKINKDNIVDFIYL